MVHKPLFHKLPPRRDQRWELARRFIETWHEPLSSDWGCSDHELKEAEARLGLRLPAALGEWYLAFAKSNIWSFQDRLLKPNQLNHVDQDDALVFRYENQGCEHWGVRREDLHRDDPPVWRLEERAEESPTITAFALQTLLLESIWRGPLLIGGSQNPGMSRFLDSLSLCDLPDHYWVLTPVFFFEGEDLFVVSSESDGFVYIVGRTEESLRQIPGDLLEQLDRPAR